MATTLDVIKSLNYEDIYKLFTRPKFKVTPEDAIKQFKVEEHEVFDQQKRPMQRVAITTTPESGGDPVTTYKLVDVVRVGIPWQQIIVERRVGFMLSDPITINATYTDKENEKEKALVRMVEQILHDNKMDYRNKEILRRKLSECEVAVIWYYVDLGEGNVPRYTLRCKIVSPELGDTLHPLFDQFGKMIAFRRDYSLMAGTKEIHHSDIYTDEFEYKYVKTDAGWVLDPDIVKAVKNESTGEMELVPANPIPNFAKKILVEYYIQTAPIWDKVQSMIGRHEEITSNHGGMNDKFGAPIFVIAADDITSEISDNKTGGILQVSNGGTADYAKLASEPESIKLEQTNLEKFIYTMSQTPDISFEAMKGIGNIAEFTMDAFFMDAQMAVKAEEETFGIGIQRRLNIIMTAIVNLIDVSLANVANNVRLTPVINPYKPHSQTELIDNLSVAVTGGILSKESAVESNPLVKDPKVELERLQSDATAELAKQTV